ncbi:MAG: hypothetical protein F4Y47_14515 [Acidobacteriia bacterium]|nr:hypothetical protein [Terriglobia bacterium]MYG02455.1 hypothetical protein [Terriglobia bacterium]MYK09635.1 hypothetical protein [Terriglobia bacterium]
MIDKNDGNEYPPEKLQIFKIMHENRISLELRGLDSEPKWVKEVRVISSPLFVNNIKIDLARLTFIVGLNQSGKTALCEWIAAGVYPHYLERWSSLPKGRDRVSIEVEYHYYGLHTVAVSFMRKDRPEYYLDSDPTRIPTAPVKIIFPQNMRIVRYDEEPSDIDLIARLMNLHTYEIQSLVEELRQMDSGYFTETYTKESEGHVMLFVKEEGSRSSDAVLFRMLGDSTCARFLMELGILAAKRFSTLYPTILILDSDFWRLDLHWANRYVELLASPEIGFQTIITVGPGRVEFDDIKWIGWNVFRLHGTPPSVTVRKGFHTTESTSTD